MSYQNSSNCGCGQSPSNGYPALNKYNQGSARVFASSGASQPVILSNYGGYGYSSMDTANYGCDDTGGISHPGMAHKTTTVKGDTSSISGYATLGTTYSAQPVPAANNGYQLLCNAYKQMSLFSGPYNARQCLK